MSNAHPVYLLDTNILVHYVRRSPVWRRVSQTYQLFSVTPTPLTCVVTEGELRSLAMQWRWADKKLSQMEFALGYFVRRPIEHPDAIRAYATIDAFCESISQTMGKNDLWIAATAAVTGATLITTDRDFDRLAPRFLSHIWVDPA